LRSFSKGAVRGGAKVAGDTEFDIAVIGAGIAGASVAAELGETRRVVLLEQESQPGYHTTGRSAALFTVAYGPPIIRALSRASEAFFRNPPEGFSANALLTPRGALFVANADQGEELAALKEELKEAVVTFDTAEARQVAPLLRESYVQAALYAENASDIDVHALHQGYLRALRARGGVLRTRARVLGLSREGARWLVETEQGRGILGVVDGEIPSGVEGPDDAGARRDFLRTIGYKR